MGAAPSRGALGWGRGSEPLPCSQLSCPQHWHGHKMAWQSHPVPPHIPSNQPPPKNPVLYFVSGSPQSRHTDPGASARPRAGWRQSSPGACL